MRKEFVMRGETASGLTEVLNFGKYKAGYAYRMTEFQIYPSDNIGGATYELVAAVTAAKVAASPIYPSFNDPGLIAVAKETNNSNPAYASGGMHSIVNDTFLITQNLILSVQDTQAGSPQPVNWQCRFESVKMTGPEEAATNFKQFSISDG